MNRGFPISWPKNFRGDLTEGLAETRSGSGSTAIGGQGVQQEMGKSMPAVYKDISNECFCQVIASATVFILFK
jgi:hypothetical protein